MHPPQGSAASSGAPETTLSNSLSPRQLILLAIVAELVPLGESLERLRHLCAATSEQLVIDQVCALEAQRGGLHRLVMMRILDLIEEARFAEQSLQDEAPAPAPPGGFTMGADPDELSTMRLRIGQIQNRILEL